MRKYFLLNARNSATAILIAAGLAVPALANQSGLQIPTTGPLPGLTLVNDTNAALQTLVTLQSGGSAPTAAGLGLPDLKGVLWHDTNSNQIKIRNQADSAWIAILTVDETSNFATPVLSVSASASNQTVGAANHPAAFVSLAAASYTLNQTTTLPAGAAFSIFAQAGNVTISINGSDKINGGSSGAGMTIPTGYVSHFKTDGASNWWVTTEPASVSSATIASASTTDICAVGASAVKIGGTSTITSFGSTCQAGQVVFATFSSTLQLINNATSLVLNRGGGNYTTSGGDRAIIKALGSSNYEVTIEPESGVALLNLPQSFTAGIAGGQNSPTISVSTFTPDLDAAQSFEIDLVHSSCPCTIANPSHQSTHLGQMGILKIKQSSTGGEMVNWGSSYIFAAGVAPILTNTAGAEDYFGYYVDNSAHIAIFTGVMNAH